MNMLVVAVVAAATTLIAPQLAPVSTPGSLPAPAGSHMRPADVIIGDGNFNEVRPESPADPLTERINHTLRLSYIESMLRNRNVSDMPAALRAERARNLDRLHAYWMRGEYPVNYEHPTAWEPCFMDTKGAICAVGYLVEQSAGHDVAAKIDSRYHFATIKQMNDPRLDQWIANSGLTKAEVVTIQGPSMQPSKLSREQLTSIQLEQADVSDTGIATAQQAATQQPVAVQTNGTFPAEATTEILDSIVATPAQPVVTPAQPVVTATPKPETLH